ncbi:hypothetical protein C9J01_14960 [Photobacterium rosenbergii]|uniref:DUF4340 domain-containing protein n=1 Tax=Photobacterium rosenbergii TaxID=294936 RepID=A0A2T3NCS6_9GAMM|nr:hypothetical protein [Photobacterium rosenbergii]PSW11820.1 hypothetical protein C9J01_14960 [Photobacterium rosenbergii]
MRLSRRGWNNVIIIAVICFIAVVQLPELVKHRFGHEGETQVQPDMTALLPTQAEIDQLHLPLTSVNREDGSWQASPRVALPADQLISHWQSLAGTAVSNEMVGKLKPTLPPPSSVEIWLAGWEEPVRVTVYQQPQFWLLKNWQGEWLAISVEEAYLFPPVL